MGESSVVRESRTGWRAAVPWAVTGVLAVALVTACYVRYTTGAWLPKDQPPRVTVCGRRYLADRVQKTSAADVAYTVGHYPLLVGRPIRTFKPCRGLVPTAVWLQTRRGEVVYGISGGP